jgi:hypothetical protein
MPLQHDLVERTLADHFQEGNDATLYWQKPDGQIFFRHGPMKVTDPETFRFYAGGFAKDRRHCYYVGTRLAGGNGANFRALNYTFATDGKFVWSVSGRVAGADPESFTVLDDGCLYYDEKRKARGNYGFAKDRNAVYYENSEGRTKIVRKADPATFVSMNDGFYGKDSQRVYSEYAPIPGADVHTWATIGSHYSQDCHNLYYGCHVLLDACPETFEVVSLQTYKMARDRNRFYKSGEVVTEAEFQEVLDTNAKSDRIAAWPVLRMETLFQPDPNNRPFVGRSFGLGAHWVLNGEGIATRKFDGHCCLVKDGKLYKRYTVKGMAVPPEGFEPFTGNDAIPTQRHGWLPIADDPNDKAFRAAWQRGVDSDGQLFRDGTYELCGPKVQGNPEGFAEPVLVRHGATLLEGVPHDYDGLRSYLESSGIEGIVWHHPSGWKVKIRAEDFGIKRRV